MDDTKNILVQFVNSWGIILAFFVGHLVDLTSDLNELFASVEKVGEVTTQYSGEKGLQVYLCREPRTLVQQFWQEERNSRLQGEE